MTSTYHLIIIMGAVHVPADVKGTPTSCLMHTHRVTVSTMPTLRPRLSAEMRCSDLAACSSWYYKNKVKIRILEHAITAAASLRAPSWAVPGLPLQLALTRTSSVETNCWTTRPDQTIELFVSAKGDCGVVNPVIRMSHGCAAYCNVRLVHLLIT